MHSAKASCGAPPATVDLLAVAALGGPSSARWAPGSRRDGSRHHSPGVDGGSTPNTSSVNVLHHRRGKRGANPRAATHGFCPINNCSSSSSREPLRIHNILVGVWLSGHCGLAGRAATNSYFLAEFIRSSEHHCETTSKTSVLSTCTHAPRKCASEPDRTFFATLDSAIALKLHRHSKIQQRC